ncbi:hypothetical protein BAMA_10370 [Bacillus manliponensis]|uniref:Permease n=1 Tax=Bacillus manliponensis TaxID=574376 RepID=A0A073JS29_9BACI|nr:hypothetical protein [Bacillus manliponensis]KEK17884.1 hypothetical protein BAMA_10370 [Bacillus manliponensis]
MNFKKRIIFSSLRYVFWSIGLVMYALNKGDTILSTVFLLLGVLTIYIEDYKLDHSKSLKKHYKEIIPIAFILLIFFLPMTQTLKILLFLLLLAISYLFSLQQIFKEKETV